jgi:DNA-directed RNA polymerase subunit H (RpoH/RPB5)
MVQVYPNGPKVLVRAAGDTAGAEPGARPRGPRGPYKKGETAKGASAGAGAKTQDSAAPVKRVMDYSAIVAAASTAQSAQSAAALAVSRIVKPSTIKITPKPTPSYIPYDSLGPVVPRPPPVVSQKQLEFRMARTKRIAEENEAKKAVEDLKNVKRVMEDVKMKETIRKHLDAQPGSVVMIQRFGSLKEESYTCVSQLWGSDNSLMERWSMSEYPPELYWEYMLSEDDFRERGFSIVINASTVDTVQVYGLNPLEKESAGTSLLKKIVDSSFVIFCGQMPIIKADVIMIVNSEAVSGLMIGKQLSKLKVHHEHNYFLVAFSKNALFTPEPPDVPEPVYLAPPPLPLPQSLAINYSQVGGSAVYDTPSIPGNIPYYHPTEQEQCLNDNDAAALLFARSFTTMAPSLSVPEKVRTHVPDRVTQHESDQYESSFHRSSSEGVSGDHNEYSSSSESKRKLERDETKKMKKKTYDSKPTHEPKPEYKPTEARSNSSSSANIYGDAPDTYVSTNQKKKANKGNMPPNAGKSSNAGLSTYTSESTDNGNNNNYSHNSSNSKNNKNSSNSNSNSNSNNFNKSNHSNNSNNNYNSINNNNTNSKSSSSSSSSSSAKGYEAPRDKRSNNDHNEYQGKKRKLSSLESDVRGIDNQRRDTSVPGHEGYSRSVPRQGEKEPYRHREPVRAVPEPPKSRPEAHIEYYKGAEERSRERSREHSSGPQNVPRPNLVAPLEFPKRNTHNSPHNRPPEPPKKPKLCHFFPKGTCKYGATCHNIHEAPDIDISGRGGYVPPPSPYDQYVQQHRNSRY